MPTLHITQDQLQHLTVALEAAYASRDLAIPHAEFEQLLEKLVVAEQEQSDRQS